MLILFFPSTMTSTFLHTKQIARTMLHKNKIALLNSNLGETPEGSAGPENPIRLPPNVHYNQAEFS
ncbi:hypothetical protein B5B97_01580 [Staphylococcus delphini]|nr:hypothetical protein B5C03_00640 [Staphylococcus delphini]PCF53808.1 hypothetical protein B5C03_00645 [Staphylococcus delphini]PCF59117.1 hypothetical protein B5B97_01575 [Staphylococcus delphini]PCF59118.1 hypothetical protein B5B97_01580 [Staphylococcus delphini]